MTHHQFIFQPGIWLGEGKITFSIASDASRFFTKWTIEKATEHHKILAQQTVEMPENDRPMHNLFAFKNITENSFIIELENELIGSISGKGVIDGKTIAWEIREKEGFEGFEVYELQNEQEYILHAEYASSPHIRTIIDGRLWKKTES